MVSISKRMVMLFDKHVELMTKLRKCFDEQDLDGMEKTWAELQQIKCDIENLGVQQSAESARG